MDLSKFCLANGGTGRLAPRTSAVRAGPTRFCDCSTGSSPAAMHPRRTRRSSSRRGPPGAGAASIEWPPADAQLFTQPLLPGTYIDSQGNSGEVLPPTESPSSALHVTGIGAWTFTPPLPGESHLAGVPIIDLRANGQPNAVAVALLYDVAPDGSALLVTRGAGRLDATGRTSFALYPQDWRFTPGHRLGVLLTGADGEFWFPFDHTQAPVKVTQGSLSLPLLQEVRGSFLDGESGVTLTAKKPITIDPGTIERRTAEAGPS